MSDNRLPFKVLFANGMTLEFPDCDQTFVLTEKLAPFVSVTRGSLVDYAPRRTKVTMTIEVQR